MTGYRRVNYYELCRLCTSNEGTKLPIFKDEGRTRQLPSKIQICLRLQISETDSLPKYICSVCLEKLECCFEFRTSCVSAEVMLQSYANALRNNVDFQTEGMVYIKEKLDETDEQESQEEPKDAEIAVGEEEEQVVHHPGLPLHLDSFATLVEAATIQIIPDIHDPQSGSDPLSQKTYVVDLVDSSSDETETSKTHKPGEVVQQSEDDQEGSETSNHTIQLTSATAHELVLLQCEERKEGDEGDEEAHTIVGHIADEDDERTSIHMEEFLKLKCSDINKNHQEEDTYLMFEQKVESEVRPPYICDICTKPFKRKEHMYQHKKLHTGERPFKCPHCVRTFSRKEHLVRHAHSHTGQKLFNCDICGKSFSRKDNVRKHRKTHEPAPPLSCEFCGMEFAIRPYYLVHMNKYKDGSCALEGKNQDGVEATPITITSAITYEVATETLEADVSSEAADVHSQESSSFEQVTSTSSSILERALTKDD